MDNFSTNADTFRSQGYVLQREVLARWPLEGYEQRIAQGGDLAWQRDPQGYLDEPAVQQLVASWELGSLLMECAGELQAIDGTACSPFNPSRGVLERSKSAVLAVLMISQVRDYAVIVTEAETSLPVITIRLRRGDVLVLGPSRSVALPAGEPTAQVILVTTSGQMSRPDLPKPIMTESWGWVFPRNDPPTA